MEDVCLKSVRNFCMNRAACGETLDLLADGERLLKEQRGACTRPPEGPGGRLLACLSGGYPLPAGNRRGSSTSSPRPLHVVSTSVQVRSTSVHVTSTLDPRDVHLPSVSVHVRSTTGGRCLWQGGPPAVAGLQKCITRSSWVLYLLSLGAFSGSERTSRTRATRNNLTCVLRMVDFRYPTL